MDSSILKDKQNLFYQQPKTMASDLSRIKI